MSSNNQDINVVPVAYSRTDYDNDPDALTLTRDTSLVVPNDDANDKTIACSARRIDKARKYLNEIKVEAEKPSSIIVDLCSMIFGIAISLLATMWTMINLYSAKGFWIYVVLLIAASSSLFTWLWLKRGRYVDVNRLIDIILDDLPDPDKTQSVKRKQ